MIPPTTYVSTAKFKDDNGTLFDPTTVTATLTYPSGTMAAYTTANVYPPVGVTNPSVGVYKLKVDCTQKGNYIVEWSGTGSAGAATEASVWKL